MNLSPNSLIEALRITDPYIKTIFTEGGCWRFHEFLRTVFPGSLPVTNYDMSHIGTLIDGEVYDVNGLVSWDWKAMSEDEIKTAMTWSFSGNAFLQIGECPVCEEPLIL